MVSILFKWKDFEGLENESIVFQGCENTAVIADCELEPYQAAG